MQRRTLLQAAPAWLLTAGWAPTWAHHGWSGFDTDRPLYLEGQAAKVAWRNPHAELELQLPATPTLPADLKSRPVPAQTAAVDGPALLTKARLPQRSDRTWTVELAPLTRLEAWRVEEIKPGTPVAVLGYTSSGEKGPPVLRAEYLFVQGKVYGLRSSPA